jgi:hypothetical protein
LIKTIVALFAVMMATAAPPIWLVHGQVGDEAGPMETLARGLEAHGYATRVEAEADFRKHMLEARPRVLFLYVHAVLTPDLENYLIAYTRGGGRLIIVHHGLASAKAQNPKYMDVLGMSITRDRAPKWTVARGTVELVNLNPGHFVTTHHVSYPKSVAYQSSDSPSVEQTLPAIEFPDTEAFLNMMFTDGRRKTVLFGVRVTTADGVQMQDRGGWMMPVGNGYVFYFQTGHFAKDFENPSYLQILMNAIEWK